MFTGVQCQSFSPPTEDICLGESITYTYTCVVVNSEPMFTTSWRLTPDGGEPRCIVQHNDPDSMDACGPGRVFTSSLTDQSGDNTTFTSTLSVGSISESLNRTRVECLDAGLETVGSKGICIVGKKVHVHVRTCTCNRCIMGFTVYGICTMQRLYVLPRVEPEEVRGRYYPMHCKNHDTADLY